MHAVGVGEVLDLCHAKPLQRMVICLEGRRSILAMNGSVVVGREQFDEAMMRLAVHAGATVMQGVVAEVLPLNHSTNPVNGARKLRSDYRSVLVTSPEPGRNVYSQNRDNESPFKDQESVKSILRGQVVLACDGLAQSSLIRLSEFQSDIQAGSRIGATVICRPQPDDRHLMNSDLLMAISKAGYVGSVFRSDGKLNIAAALDTAFVKDNSSVAHAVAAILAKAGINAPVMLREMIAANTKTMKTSDDFWFKGTPPLTRRSRRVAADRVLLLGDSTGYIEPFTGEGMAWAITAAAAVQPVIQSVLALGWSDESARSWSAIHESSVGRSQNICRTLSSNLRRKWLLHPMLTICQLFPSIAQSLIRQMNRMPAMPEPQ